MKTTKKDFELFKRECERWVEIMGMFGWRFHYQHKDHENHRVFAYCIWPDEAADRVFTLGLSVHLDRKPSNHDIRKAAFHEVMEAFLFRISFLGGCRYLQPEEIPEERHNLIITLEKVLWKVWE